MSEHRLMRYFTKEPYELTEDTRTMLKMFHVLAENILGAPDTKDPAEQTVALRKLLESRDAFLRSVRK